jgi:hypothetical protein
MKRLLPLLIAIIMVACTPQKKMLKEATTLENGGLREEAFNKYTLIYRDWENAEARVGMRRTAQELLNQKLANARMACLSGNYEQALEEYEQAFAYQSKFQDLELQGSSMAQDAYNQCKIDYVNYLYETAEDHVMAEEFEEAQRKINRIYSLDRNNKKVKYLEMMCDILPNYNAGKQAFDLGMYHEAYVYLTEVTRIDVAFRDAKFLRDECIRIVGYTIAYVPINHPKICDAVEATLGAAIKDHILDLKDPFIHLVERENLDQLLVEQKQSMEGIFDEATAIEAGKLLGARYLVTGEIISFDSDLSRLRENERKGFLGSTPQSKHVRYMEYTRSRTLDVSFRYQLVDALTGRIYASETIPFSASDKAEWAEFEGDPDMIWPGEWKYQLIGSQEDYVDRDKKEELRKKLKANKEPLSEMELQLRLSNFIGNKVSQAIANFKPELKK